MEAPTIEAAEQVEKAARALAAATQALIKRAESIDRVLLAQSPEERRARIPLFEIIAAKRALGEVERALLTPTGDEPSKADRLQQVAVAIHSRDYDRANADYREEALGDITADLS